ncbi:Cobyric acid synthase [Candidatus Magnetomoraceae bacterium gMMP-15]
MEKMTHTNFPSNKNSLCPCLAVFGTGSDVGKSIIAAGICRFFSNQGISVSPFKAQNMSNNSGVTPDGLEMGRAQIVQAEAARIVPHVDMNPILLKPTSDVGSQVILLGRAVGNSLASDYHKKKNDLFLATCSALDRLRRKYKAIVIEGAGSCAEVNLASHDIVNFSIAEYADAPVILVADIHRGGVFAQIVGTLECLPKKQRDRIAGFIINRFRGDINLFQDGIKWIENKTNKPVFGVLPWYNHFYIDQEDSVVLENPPGVNPDKIDGNSIAVIRIPHISNFTDFEPLLQLKNLNVFFLEKVQDLFKFKAVIIPGSKNTRYDLEWAQKLGWAKKLKEYRKHGGHILGICGGYQMMGQSINDPDGLEGKPGKSKALELLPVETTLMAPKTTTLTHFSWHGKSGQGYEIHAGQTVRLSGSAMFIIHSRNSHNIDDKDGCMTEDKKVCGTYIHGLFDSPDILKLWLKQINLNDLEIPRVTGITIKDQQYELLSQYMEKYLDMMRIKEKCYGKRLKNLV